MVGLGGGALLILPLNRPPPVMKPEDTQLTPGAVQEVAETCVIAPGNRAIANRAPSVATMTYEYFCFIVSEVILCYVHITIRGFLRKF